MVSGRMFDVRRTSRVFLVLLQGLCFIFGGRSTKADLLYLDDFEQFPSGSNLSHVSYVSPAGPVGASASFNVKTYVPPSPTIIASNFLGSTRAFFNFPNNQGNGDGLYTCTLSAPLANQVLNQTWTLWDPSQDPSVGTGFYITLPATNGAINGPLVSLLRFDDNGTIYAVNTNSAVNNYSFVRIGSWANLRGTVMTNQLILNYPAHTFSFSLNGVILTNMPLCGLFTNFVTQTGFDASEDSLGPPLPQFALDDVMVEAAQIPEPASSVLVIAGVVALLCQSVVVARARER